MMTKQTATTARVDSRADIATYYCVFVPLFIVCLFAATVARLTGWKWYRPWPPGRHGYDTVLKEAVGAARTYAPFAFMG